MLAQGTGSSLARAAAGKRDRYDLATALRIVRRLETSESRASIFEEIKRKNLLYRLVDAAYTLAGKPLFQPLILWAYMLKSALMVGPLRAGDARVIALSHFPNEKRTIERVAGLVPDITILRLSMKRRHLFGPGQLKAALTMVGALPRIWRFLRTLARTHDFMPAGRIASALAFYMRFNQYFEEQADIDAAIVASNYSPEAVGLAASAHKFGRNVVYANHAPVPANCPVVPPVHSDCALFYGEQTARTYRQRSVCTAEVAYIGQPGTARPMEWSDRLEKVGIFLTAGTRAETLSGLIADIRRTHPEVEILVRDHPVALLRNDLGTIVTEDARIALTIGNPLEDEIAQCDLVICGNSGVVLDTLCGGKPVAYLAELDEIAFDYNGFVRSRLVFHAARWNDEIYADLRRFYLDHEWIEIMKGYDASYLANADDLMKTASFVLRRHLSR